MAKGSKDRSASPTSDGPSLNILLQEDLTIRGGALSLSLSLTLTLTLTLTLNPSPNPNQAAWLSSSGRSAPACSKRRLGSATASSRQGQMNRPLWLRGYHLPTPLVEGSTTPSTTPLLRPSRCSGSKALLLFGGDARTSELRTAGKQVVGRTTHRLGKQVVGRATHRLGKQVVGRTTHRLGKQVVGLLIGLGT